PRGLLSTGTRETAPGARDPKGQTTAAHREQRGPLPSPPAPSRPVRTKGPKAAAAPAPPQQAPAPAPRDGAGAPSAGKAPPRAPRRGLACPPPAGPPARSCFPCEGPSPLVPQGAPSARRFAWQATGR